MKHKLNKSPEEVYEAIKEHVTYARKFTDDVEWSCEDGTRTDMDYMCKTVEPVSYTHLTLPTTPYV